MSRAILVVDDEPNIAKTIASLLTSEGNEVRTARNGVEALRCLDDWSADLVITDVVMPMMSGFELAADLLRAPNPPAIVVLSAVARPTQLPAAIPFLMKPFDLDELLGLVSAALA